MSKNSIFFFDNGLTAVTDGQNQVPELQESWLQLFIKFLESKDADPENFEYNLPGGRFKAELVKLSNGEYNYKIVKGE